MSTIGIRMGAQRDLSAELPVRWAVLAGKRQILYDYTRGIRRWPVRGGTSISRRRYSSSGFVNATASGRICPAVCPANVSNARFQPIAVTSTLNEQSRRAHLSVCRFLVQGGRAAANCDGSVVSVFEKESSWKASEEFGQYRIPRRVSRRCSSCRHRWTRVHGWSLL